uniref:Gypsy retrotransposon integrase-like protein 1 n=1 Tax=Myripristis murdjan TaxID=586833 RepID=A0A668AQP4_9TELE
MTGLLDTGSQATLMRQSVLASQFPDYGVKELPSFVRLRAANGLKIPCLGYAMMDFEIEGHKIVERGVFIVDDEFSSNPLIIGMNVVQACWDTVFKGAEGPVSFSCQNPKFQHVWREAFAVCRRTTVTAEDGFLGYIWPARRRGVVVPARSEVVVWGRARSGPQGQNYCGLVEALPEPSSVAVARTLVAVSQGRVPVRLRNLNEFPVSIGRYQKLGRLFQVEEADVHGTRDVSLMPGEDGVVEVGVVEASAGEEKDPVFDLLGMADRPDLTAEEQGKLAALLKKWEKVFSANEEDFGRTNIVQHQIPTGDANPVRERFRPLPPLLYKEMRALLSGMLQGGIITESSSPWAAPIVMVRKKDGSWRFCVDYRKLNSVTHKDAFPLPRIEETLTSMTKAEWFSTLDLASGYWQVEVDPRDREKTAFTTPLGLFEFQRMPFGLCNAPATFQRLMQQCLSGQITESLLVYLDDIIVYSPDFATHLRHLDEVFERLWKHGLKLRPDKCKLLHREVKFLGHVVNQKGVLPDPEKVSAVTDWPVPTTAKQLKAFLGLAGYYRRFVPEFAKVARPLNTLMVGIPNDKKLGSRPITWSAECQVAFEALKKALTQAPILAYADFNQPFVLYTDASNQGLGAVLAQVQEGKERVIAYASRSLHPTERNDANYSSFKLELLALKWAITEKFKDYLTGAKFVVFTDNNPVAHLQSARLGAVEQRWVAQLASFDFEVKYRAGRENTNADALSRFPTASEPPVRTGNDGVGVSAVAITAAELDNMPEDLCEGWEAAQIADPDLQIVRRYVEQSIMPSGHERRTLSDGVTKLLRQHKRLCIQGGVLCRKVIDPNTHELNCQIVCPAARHLEVWRRHHEATAHAGAERTLSSLRRHFFWTDMDKEVRGFQSGCTTCSIQKDRTEPRAPL